MFFTATFTDIYEIEDTYYITCMVDSNSSFQFHIRKSSVYGPPYIGAPICGHYDENKQITNLFILFNEQISILLS
ncbi:hypothetical protein CON32_18910 [Bacillus cereus]|nr:hypothetical protein CON32_18910 [Bacillus cereus]